MSTATTRSRLAMTRPAKSVARAAVAIAVGRHRPAPSQRKSWSNASEARAASGRLLLGFLAPALLPLALRSTTTPRRSLKPREILIVKSPGRRLAKSRSTWQERRRPEEKSGGERGVHASASGDVSPTWQPLVPSGAPGLTLDARLRGRGRRWRLLCFGSRTLSAPFATYGIGRGILSNCGRRACTGSCSRPSRRSPATGPVDHEPEGLPAASPPGRICQLSSGAS